VATQGRTRCGQPTKRTTQWTSTADLALCLLVAVIAMGAACLDYLLSMWAIGDLIKDPSTVLGSLFTLIGTMAGVNIGIRVSNDTSEV
jgi:hypothetical protein